MVAAEMPDGLLADLGLPDNSPPKTIPLTQQTDLFTQFARSLCGEAPPPLRLHEACRITESALKAQHAADSKSLVSLADSLYRAV